MAAGGASVPAPARETCVLVTNFSDAQPGFLDFVYRARALSERYRLTIISRAPLDQPEWAGIDADFLTVPAGESRREWAGYLNRCGALVRRLAPARVVLLHSTLAPLTWLCGSRRTALYWNEHPTHFSPAPATFSLLRTPVRILMQRLLYWGARRATLVMPIGEAHYDDLIENGIDKSRCRLIYMGVNESFQTACAAPRERAGEHPVELVYVGSVSKPRGRDVMLEGLAAANRDGVVARLTIVGASDAELDYCVRRAAELEIAGEVRIIGRVPGGAIPSYLGAADAGVCLWEDRPWWRFNPPTKLFEYMVAGLPVLASDIRTHTAYIEDGRNGLVFEYGPRGFADAVTRLWGLRNSLPQMRAEARASGQPFLWPAIEPVFVGAVAALPGRT